MPAATSLRVFVIDDEECIRDTFRWHLEDQGHAVFTAAKPTSCPVFQGHDCPNDHPCGHVLFIDYFLGPGMTAFDYIAQMQERGCKGAARNKIVMSGDTTKIDLEKAWRLECRVMQKPVNIAQIDDVIKQILPSIDPSEQLARL